MIAVLTAGGTVDADFAREIGTDVKALAPWRSMKLIDPAIDAARACGSSEIIIVGNKAIELHCMPRVSKVLPAFQDGRTNLQAALQCAHPDKPLLLLTSDMPFITPDALKNFLARTEDCDIAMPLADGTSYERCYPDASNHVTNLGGERIANGSAFYFSSGIIAARAITVAKRLFQARKSLVQMASLLDMPLLLRFITRTLQVRHLEAYADRRFSFRARGVRDAAPSLCFDIDSVEDYRYAVAYPHAS